MEATTNNTEALAAAQQQVTYVKQRLENAYRNMVTSAKDFVERSIITAPEARTLLENALVPEEFYAGLGQVTVEVELELTASISYTMTVEVTVDADYEEDDLIDAIDNRGIDVPEEIMDNIYDAYISDDNWEINGSEVV